MPNEVKLLPCDDAVAKLARNALRDRIFDTANDDNLHRAVESATYRMYNSEIARFLLRFVAAAESRPTTIVTDEVVERVARAMAQESGRDPDGITAAARGHMGSRKLWELYEHLARAALASMPTVVTGEQSGWQTIESAPREEFSSVILIARDGRGNGKRCVMPALFDGECWQSISLVGLMPFVNPTHWQPLPEPPAQPGDA